MVQDPTLAACLGSGSNATFQFLGQQVAVYGTEYGQGATSSYSIDGQIISSHTSQGSGVGVLLFHSDVLSDAIHTLVINVTAASEAVPFTFDWIEYNSTARGASQTATIASSISTSLSSQTPSLPPSTSMEDPPSASHSLATGRASKTSVSTVAIVGGLVGGLAGLTSIILALVALRNRRRRRMSGPTQYSYGEVAQYDTDNFVVPELGAEPPAIVVIPADDTVSMQAVYICIPPGPIDIPSTAFATYILDGIPAGPSYYVPLTDRNLFIPRFAHFTSEEMLAIPGGTHNLTIEASATLEHPYLLDYIVLWNKYLGPNQTYPDSPTLVSTLSAPPASGTVASTGQTGVTPVVGVSNTSIPSPSSVLSSPVGSAPVDTLPSASFQPSSRSPATSYIAGAIAGSIAAAAALVAASFFVYRRRRRGKGTNVPTDDSSNECTYPDHQPLMDEAQSSRVGAMGAAEGHLHDSPTDTPLGFYTSLVRHETDRGKVKEIHLKPSRSDLSDYFGSHPDMSMEPHVITDDAPAETLPLYTRSSGGESSQMLE
ncbi:hypothetical protein BD309DRAFT_865789 [Dichomitus squalens]|nr:hypothetical protein BD309DRAFT_865789 [Dichomitus squalens]